MNKTGFGGEAGSIMTESCAGRDLHINLYLCWLTGSTSTLSSVTDACVDFQRGFHKKEFVTSSRNFF